MPLLSLEPLIEVRGIRHAAMLDAQGVAILQAGGTPDISIAQAGRAVAASLIATIGGDLQDMLIDLDGGPVLLTPYGDQTLMTAFDDVANLGRIRYAVRKLLSSAQPADA